MRKLSNRGGGGWWCFRTKALAYHACGPSSIPSRRDFGPALVVVTTQGPFQASKKCNGTSDQPIHMEELNWTRRSRRTSGRSWEQMMWWGTGSGVGNAPAGGCEVAESTRCSHFPRQGGRRRRRLSPERWWCSLCHSHCRYHRHLQDLQGGTTTAGPRWYRLGPPNRLRPSTSGVLSTLGPRQWKSIRKRFKKRPVVECSGDSMRSFSAFCPTSEPTTQTWILN